MARKLRIAVSVFFGVMAVVLFVLWLMSYKWLVIGQASFPDKNAFVIHSARGSLSLINTKVNLPWSFSLGTLDRGRGESAPDLHLKFNLTSNPAVSRIQMPHWFAVLVTASVAALPWVHRSFSLRTLLISTTLVAVVLGLAVWAGR